MKRAAVVLVVALATAACASAKPQATPVTVLAASSLTDAFPAIDKAEKYSFGGSDTLAAQIANGAPADVFASANTKLPAQLHAQGLVDAPVNFTHNALVVVVPKSNPAGVRSVSDLARPGVKVVVADASVPVGGYTEKVLAKLRLKPHVVSRETDVRSVLTKVALGQADAGFVYATDAKTVPGRVRVIQLPARAQPNVTYAIAVVSSSSNKAAARAFIAQVLSKAGQATLRRYGFR